MAKDGTARGGARSGSGRKSKALADKILDGQRTATLPLPELKAEDNIHGEDMPPVSEYMKAEQHVGIPLKAEQVFKMTWEFLLPRVMGQQELHCVGLLPCGVDVDLRILTDDLRDVEPGHIGLL